MLSHMCESQCTALHCTASCCVLWVPNAMASDVQQQNDTKHVNSDGHFTIWNNNVPVITIFLVVQMIFWCNGENIGGRSAPLMPSLSRMHSLLSCSSIGFVQTPHCPCQLSSLHWVSMHEDVLGTSRHKFKLTSRWLAAWKARNQGWMVTSLACHVIATRKKAIECWFEKLALLILDEDCFMMHRDLHHVVSIWKRSLLSFWRKLHTWKHPKFWKSCRHVQSANQPPCPGFMWPKFTASWLVSSKSKLWGCQRVQSGHVWTLKNKKIDLGVAPQPWDPVAQPACVFAVAPPPQSDRQRMQDRCVCSCSHMCVLIPGLNSNTLSLSCGGSWSKSLLC